MLRTSLLLLTALLAGCSTLPKTPATDTGTPGLTAQATLTEQPAYLSRAHSHNDYQRAEPLSEALRYGFASVEADIHLMDGQLRIGHALALDPSRTLESLYLRPLRERVLQNGGWVYRPGEVLTLYVDVKTDTASTYWALEKLLSNYRDILSTVIDGQVQPGPVMVIVTGNRDRELARNESPRFSFQEGNLNDLYSSEPLSLIPAVSAKWGAEFRWLGVFDLSAEERQKLQELGAQARAKGRLLRFWAAPQTWNAYRELVAADITRINTDNIPKLATFLQGQ